MNDYDFDKMVQARLFDNTAPWPMPPGEELADFYKAVEIMGLGEPDCRSVVGEANDLDLLMAFLGILDSSEVPPVLQEKGLIDDAECEWLWTLLGDGVDHEVLRPAVKRAYTRAMKEGIIRWRIN